jgi:NADH:ubiquinone oxidoreductase subunit F (NADH-binding)/NADH:ubiquinone oxidoreductase subunit E/NAD-dependent dihydropyrimidine dehydrogenase PreA subunit
MNMTVLDFTVADAIVDKIGRTPDAVLPILQAVQEEYGYLPREVLERVCHRTEITPAAISGVASFFDMFRHQPVGKYLVRVCHGTACHVTGAERVEDALRRRLRIPAGDDTDPDRQFTIEPVACLGCCTLAPVVRVEQETFGHVTVEKVPSVVHDFLTQQETDRLANGHTELLRVAGAAGAQIHVGLGSCCMAKGSDRLFRALQQTVEQSGAAAVVKRVGCVGMCHRTPMIEVAPAGQTGSFYAGLTPALAPHLIQRHFRPRGILQRASRLWTRALDTLLLDDGEEKVTRFSMSLRDPSVKAFLERQVHIATEHFGRLDPLDLDEYVSCEGFTALRRCLGELTAEKTIETIERSGLRGRGGAGFPSGSKWRVVQQQTEPTKYVICNGDEGDPGAFMDRMILESFPFRVLEGLAIAGVAVGAHEGIFYIRHEYPLAVRRVQATIEQCERRGWLGEHLLGTDYAFRVTIKQGAGAFVCGEETALIASIEGRRGMPRLRPPFPAQSGLWAKPTLINNVETLALVPWIIRHGAEAFAQYGTASSKGTKVFALAGKIRRGGLIEIQMGTTIREIVDEIGGGVGSGRRFKAVQIGGPSGGCVPARLAETPVDYESLRDIGAIMGSGGLVVLDDTDCMVDIARYFLQFTQDQSCGKCTFCRIGTKRMLDILDRLCAGKAHKQDLEALEQLAGQVSQGSLCGLGKTAPNPVLTTLRYFRHEYEAHLQGRCPAGKCYPLIKYQVLENCTGCTLCAQTCPVNAIPLTPYQRHVINQDLCTKCDSCRQVCPVSAIEVK